jgi:hypothetical protein
MRKSLYLCAATVLLVLAGKDTGLDAAQSTAPAALR